MPSGALGATGNNSTNVWHAPFLRGTYHLLEIRLIHRIVRRLYRENMKCTIADKRTKVL